MSSHSRSEAAVAYLAGELTRDYDTEELLQYICDQSVSCLDVVLATLVVLDPDQRLSLVATGSDEALSTDSESLFGRGPSAESALTGGISMTDDIRDEPLRWPDVAPLMGSLKLIGARGFPLRLFGQPLGSLTLYTRDSWGTERGSLIGQTFADLAVTILSLDKIPQRRLRSVAAVVTSLVDQSTFVYQAQGMVAQYCGVTVDQAIVMVGDYAQKLGLSVSRVSRWVVEGTVMISALIENLPARD